MRLRPILSLLVCLCIGLTAAGCNLAGEPPTPTPEPTAAPTETPPPSATPEPATPTPLPSPTPVFSVVPFNPAPAPNAPGVLVSAPSSSLYSAPGASGAIFFSVSPANSAHYATIDSFGTLTVFRNGGQGGLPAPFTGFAPASRETNDKLATGAFWSADGASVAVLIDNPARRDANEGVWVWTLDAGINQVLRNCRTGTNNCGNFVIAEGGPDHWYATSAAWSPDGQQLIIRAVMEDVGYEGFMVIGRAGDPNRRPPFCRYEFSEWSLDGTRVVVSGRDPNGQPTLGTVDPTTCGDFRPAPVAQLGLPVLTHGTQASDGRLVALGRPGTAFGAMYLYDQDGNQITSEIGTARPERVQWNAARDAGWMLASGGRHYVFGLNGAAAEIPGISANTPVAWGQ
ncbi:MAG: hypothetical protein MUF38_15445 [Anaerolineae bacterium]|nr:hypothetical protein [Anaerolineae bacterium]